MRVLVIGSGAREHALCARLARSADVLCTPGNPGIATVARCVATPVTELSALVDLALRESVGLVVVGPEAPLVAGLSDLLHAAGVPCFGPSQRAAEVEGSKSFSKDFMARHGIPTAAYESFTNADAAAAYIRSRRGPVVVKASGLAAGKGVVVCSTADEALEASDAMLRLGAFGAAGACVVIEDRLEGEEISFHVITDGERYVVLGSAQDHKRLGEGDTGPNTGGMGAYGPVPILTPALSKSVCSSIVEPTLAGLVAEGRPFRGVLFVGLMVHEGTATVLEYNARFGDPECAVLLPRVEGDLLPLLLGAAQGRLPDAPLVLSNDAAIAVVMASAGYPASPRLGDPIHGLEALASLTQVQVLHAGTRKETDATVTAGGRVLTLVATASTLDEASERAYGAAGKITFAGAQYRRDVGWRARKRSSPGAT